MSTNGFGSRPTGADGNGSGNGASPRPPLALRVEQADVVPGVPGQVLLAVRNDSGQPAEVRFDVAGLNPEWLTGPELGGVLAPGDTRQANLTIRLPAGYPPSELRAALHARAVGPATGVALGRPASADIVLRVAETGLVDATMPDEVYGAFHGRFQVSVRNRGREGQAVEFSGSSPVGRVRWSTRRIRLEPGAQAKVRASVDSRRAFTGPVRRVPFAVKVKGRGAPVTLGGTFVQRPWLSSLVLKAGAILTTVLLFAALATFLVVKLTTAYAPNSTAVPTVKLVVPKPKVPKVPLARPHRTTSTTSAGKGQQNSTTTGTAKTGTTQTSGTHPGATKTSTAQTTGATGSGATGSGATGSGATGPGSTGSGSKAGPASTNAAAKASASTTSTTAKASGSTRTSAAAQDVAISGQVTAANASGVTVSVQPASLVQQANSSATSGAGTGTASAGPIGKLQGSPGDPPGDPSDPTSPGPSGSNVGPFGSSFSTSTIGSGFFTFPAEFASPGNYLVTFSKPGYATQKFVVTATGAPVNLNVNLTPGPGSLSGEVFGPDGPLGGAVVTVTDGTVTCSARTPTEGPVGKWSMSGLTTPDTYLVTASAPGYAAATTLVTLGAGKSSSGVDLSVKAGVASIVGTVNSPQGPVGGINVTATDGTVTQSVTTLTGARDLSGGVVGTYVIPDLSVQGPWTLTASARGGSPRPREWAFRASRRPSPARSRPISSSLPPRRP